MYEVWYRANLLGAWYKATVAFLANEETRAHVIANVIKAALENAGHMDAQAEVREVEAKRLPTIEEIGGSDPDFTGGLSSEEYVRRMRDEREERLYGPPAVEVGPVAFGETPQVRAWRSRTADSDRKCEFCSQTVKQGESIHVRVEEPNRGSKMCHVCYVELVLGRPYISSL